MQAYEKIINGPLLLICINIKVVLITGRDNYIVNKLKPPQIGDPILPFVFEDVKIQYLTPRKWNSEFQALTWWNTRFGLFSNESVLWFVAIMKNLHKQLPTTGAMSATKEKHV